MRVGLIQHSPRLNKTNLDFHLQSVNETLSDIVVFPELSLNGYMLQDKVYEDFWNLDELNSLIKLSDVCDIVAGAVIKVDDSIYNSALYLSAGRVIHIHNKVHLPNYGMFEEARYFSKGTHVESFDTKYGKSAMVVCEDLWHGSTIAELSETKVKYIYVLAASPARGFTDESLLIEDEWNSILKSTALMCHAYVIFVNRVGFEDGLGFWGGSKIVDPYGTIVHSLEKFETLNSVFKIEDSIHNLHDGLIKSN